MQTEAAPDQPALKPDRITRWIVIAIGIYSALLYIQLKAAG
jgi:hypothetical protein